MRADVTADAVAFDPRADLPAGVTVLEASAGTGKTYTIAALATRAVALDGIELERLLAVTFTRAATGELRERIRDRLVRSERLLREGRTAEGDEVDALLAEGTRDEVRERCRRLRRALAGFDEATIVTLHGFCQAVLGTLGVAGDLDPDAGVVEEVDDLREQVLLDLYLRRFRTHAPLFGLSEARDVVKAAIGLPEVDVLPPDTRRLGDAAESRGRLARVARDELDARKRRARLLTFDDLIVRLRRALASDDGEALCGRLRTRWELVLVDEFQDTDPIQWEVLERAFVAPGTRLVLIGDPKQAIYAFRGADVHAYLRALDKADTLRTLDVNQRSDQDLIDAHDALLGNAQLGHARIGYRTVRARHAARRLRGAPDSAALRVRVVDRYRPGIVRTRAKDVVQVGSARDHTALDCARDIARLLASDAQIAEERGRWRAIRARDVAVLCRKTENAHRVHAELQRLGVPVVLAGAGSVFATQAATDWLRLLEALERPTYEGGARRAALTPFVGWDAARLAAATPAELEEVHARLHAWARVLRSRGMAALAETITVDERLPARVLGGPGGERALTDLRHVAELLHRTGTADGLGATALATWLRRRIAEARAGDEDQDRTRRLESDQYAVHVLTIHRAKGLEYPVVYLPDLWDVIKPRAGSPAAFHDDDGRRLLDVSLGGGDYNRHVAAKVTEERGEELRLFYVALTRARHQAVLWWAGTDMASCSPLTRLLLDRDETGAVGTGLTDTPADERMTEALTEVAARVPGRMTVAAAAWPDDVRLAGDAQLETGLDVRRFDRELDLAWRRTSYSALAAGVRELRLAVGSEVEQDLLADEPAAEEEPVHAPGGGHVLQRMPAGREVGTVVHRVLERVDFAAPDLTAVLRDELARVAVRGGTDLGSLDDAAAGLATALATPLGPVLGGLALTSIAQDDRLDELTFELPLAGGDVAAGEVTLARIGAVLAEHLADDDPVRPYADVLTTPGLAAAFRGYLTGSVDVVCRWRGEDGDWRFMLADYKTNRLAGYEQESLMAEMVDKHYLLQALIYLVALHRHLRSRLPGYDAGRHLQGAAYLFVRGMRGPGEPGSGVVSWRPSGALLDALSGAFEG